MATTIGIPLNLSEMMRQASEETEQPTRPQVDAQRMELEARWLSYHRHEDIKPGTLVVEKDGIGVFKPNLRRNTILMLWRYLDPEDPIDAIIIKDWVSEHRINRLDCILAYITDDGSTLDWIPHEAAQLRAVDQDVLLKHVRRKP